MIPVVLGQVLDRLDREDVSGHVKTALCLLAVARTGLTEHELCEAFGIIRSGEPLPLIEWVVLYSQIRVFTRNSGSVAKRTKKKKEREERKEGEKDEQI